jgi:hypothetical protein
MPANHLHTCMRPLHPATGVRPESSGGARVTAVLEPGTKVLQITSLGTKARPCPAAPLLLSL